MEDEKQVPPPSPEAEVIDDGKKTHDVVKTTSHGVALIPRPSNDPRDPLVWSKASFLSTSLYLQCQELVYG